MNKRVIILIAVVAVTSFLIGFSYNKIIKPDFEMIVDPSSLEAYNQQKNSPTITITLKSINGFNQPIQLSTEDLPSAFTPIFKSSTITCPAYGEISTTLSLGQSRTSQIGPYTHVFKIHGMSGSLIHSKSVTLRILEGIEPGTDLMVTDIVFDINNDKVFVTIKNEAVVPATIASISIIKKRGGEFIPGEPFYNDTSSDATGIIGAESQKTFIWTESDASTPEGFLAFETPYSLLITTASGHKYEIGAFAHSTS